MLTVAYCRVSTRRGTRKASIAGQRSCRSSHTTGEVTVITDPGLSGKNLDRPGLQQILAMGSGVTSPMYSSGGWIGSRAISATWCCWPTGLACKESRSTRSLNGSIFDRNRSHVLQRPRLVRAVLSRAAG